VVDQQRDDTAVDQPWAAFERRPDDYLTAAAVAVDLDDELGRHRVRQAADEAHVRPVGVGRHGHVQPHGRAAEPRCQLIDDRRSGAEFAGLGAGPHDNVQ
jgi:hypothetical protein